MGTQQVLVPRRRYGLSVAVHGDTFLWDFWRNYLYHKVWYKVWQLYTAEKHQLGTKAAKMKTK